MQMAIPNRRIILQIVWKKMYDTTTLSYNPIENYDKTDETTENENISENITRNDTLKNTTDNTGNSEIINQNEAYNDKNYTNHEKTMNNVDNNIVETFPAFLFEVLDFLESRLLIISDLLALSFLFASDLIQ